jgi:hypothetical protein
MKLAPFPARSTSGHCAGLLLLPALRLGEGNETAVIDDLQDMLSLWQVGLPEVLPVVVYRAVCGLQAGGPQQLAVDENSGLPM